VGGFFLVLGCVWWGGGWGGGFGVLVGVVKKKKKKKKKKKTKKKKKKKKIVASFKYKNIVGKGKRPRGEKNLADFSSSRIAS